MIITYTLEDGREIVVDFSCYGATKGYRNSLGVPEEPDEDPSIELNSITDEDGNEIKVSENEQLTIEEACLEKE